VYSSVILEVHKLLASSTFVLLPKGRDIRQYMLNIDLRAYSPFFVDIPLLLEEDERAFS